VVDSVVPYGMSPQVLSGVVRIATNRRAFAEPYKLTEVLRFCNTLIDQPYCQIIQPGPTHWGIFCECCRKAAASGGLVQDAWFAALAIEWGCEWVTNDKDFDRFPSLRWRTPF
jgi:predicted nucleic acid-binding protein